MRSVAILILASSLGACGEPHPNRAQAPAAPFSSVAWVPTWGTSSTSTPPPAITASASASVTPVATDRPPVSPTPDPASSPQADRAVSAVLKLPGVQGMCSEAIARGAASCSAWVAQPSNGPCKNQKVAYENEDCWWTINLEEVMHYPEGDGDHENRLATFYVDPPRSR